MESQGSSQRRIESGLYGLDAVRTKNPGGVVVPTKAGHFTLTATDRLDIEVWDSCEIGWVAGHE